MTERSFSIAVLISGGGTTLRNLLEKQAAGNLEADIGLVISSNRNAGGISIAETADIDCRVFDFREYATAESISQPIFDACRTAGIDLVVMGGFLRRLIIPDDFENRVVNIHPSLIPEFCGEGMYGLRVHQAVLQQGAQVTGCTVHFVDNQYDHGPIIDRQLVSVLPHDSPESLAARVFQAECDAYPRVINSIARDKNRQT